MAGPRGERPGKISLRTVQPGVLEAVYSGYLSVRIADETFPAFQATLARGTITHWILNALAMDGFENRLLISAQPWLQVFKAQGGRMLIVVSESGPVRMAAGAMGFAAGLSLKTVATRSEVSALLPAR